MLRPWMPVVLMLIASLPAARAEDWSQWRGPLRDGVAHDSPPLRTQLPAEGLSPLWIGELKIPAGGSGGWGSPIVADGRVYLFAHTKTQITKGALPARRFPGLSEEQRARMSDEEIADYERQQREEQEEINKHFRHDEQLYAFNQKTGKLLWKNERPSVRTNFPQSGTPLAADDRLYILGAGLTARCIEAATGEDLWTTRLPGEFKEEQLPSSFAVAEGVAVVLANGLFGLDARSGQLLWQADREQIRGQNSSPVVWRNNNREWIVVNISGGQTVCVDPRTGEEQWRVASQAANSTPVIAFDQLLTYAASRKGGLRAYDLKQNPPELLWTCQRVADSGSSPVTFEGKVFAQGDRQLACIDQQTGKPEWTLRLDLEQPRYTSPVAADDKIFYTFEGVLCVAADGERQVLYNGKIDNSGLLAEEAFFRQKLKLDELERTAEGQKEAVELWRKTFSEHRPLACSSPALADGRLYLRTQTGLICYDLRAPAGE